jgi:hypothetical protein
MRKILITLFLFVFSYTQANDISLFYLSIRGTWDTNKDNTRAQFGGNNELLKNHFSTTSSVLFGLGYINDICEATFTVTPQGTVENIKIVKGIGPIYDRFIIQMIQATNGKWRPGIVNNTRVSEEITIWMYIYKGGEYKKPLMECLEKSEKLMDEKEYLKAEKYIDIALKYNRFSVRAIGLKIKALNALGKAHEVCGLLIENGKYYSNEINNLIQENNCGN